MAQTILVKRGLEANLPAVLQIGELAYTTDTQKLYVGTGTGRVLVTRDDFELPDVGTAGTYYKVTTDDKGRVISGQTTLSTTDITGLGTAATKNVGTASGNVPVLNSSGKLDSSVIPAIAISDTFVVNSETAMLALDAQIGDIAVRTDLNKSFILKTEGASTLANWQELLTPTDSVTSVAGKTGAVTLTSSDVGLGNVLNVAQIPASEKGVANGVATLDTDGKLTAAQKPTYTKAEIGLGNVDNTSDLDKPISTATQTALNAKAPLASPALTGTPTAPTAAVDTNTTQIATTAFVIGQAASTAPLGLADSAVVGTSKRYARADHQHPMPTVIDGGTF